MVLRWYTLLVEDKIQRKATAIFILLEQCVSKGLNFRNYVKANQTGGKGTLLRKETQLERLLRKRLNCGLRGGGARGAPPSPPQPPGPPASLGGKEPGRPAGWRLDSSERERPKVIEETKRRLEEGSPL